MTTRRKRTLVELAYAAAVRHEGWPVTDGRGNMMSCTSNSFFKTYEDGWLAGYRAAQRDARKKP